MTFKREMKGFSYWEQKYFWHSWNFTIVGSGITGLMSAIFLKRKFKDANICVLERGMLPTGASTKNAGFACFGSVSEILDDLTRMTEKEVFELVAARYEGLETLRGLLGDEHIGYQPTGGYELFQPDARELYKYCLGSLSYVNAELVQSIGKQAFRDATSKIGDFGFKNTDYMLVNDLEGVIDTGLMMKNLIALAKEEGVHLFNGAEVLEIQSEPDACRVFLPQGDFKTDSVVVATNGFARRLLPKLEVDPNRAQVLLTSPIENLPWSGSFHHDRGYDYFRDIDGRVLLGGGRQHHREEEQTDEFGLTKSVQDYLETLLREVILPNREFTIEKRWSGIMGLGPTKTVILEETQPNVLCAVRLGGMGIALGARLGRGVADFF